jgi:hypothetical protein
MAFELRLWIGSRFGLIAGSEAIREGQTNTWALWVKDSRSRQMDFQAMILEFHMCGYFKKGKVSDENDNLTQRIVILHYSRSSINFRVCY